MGALELSLRDLAIEVESVSEFPSVRRFRLSREHIAM